ncbi:hypothetical protein B0H11DRAFT_1329494 [Mycena galericulata]|nr:hypothetical protein B0H11DRAFT_1329494 [Mycena galericulata]
MDVDSPRYNSEQDYAIESQYPHIQSPDFAPNAPLTSALDMPLSSMTFASSITRNTPSIFASLSHSPFYRDLQAPTDSVQQVTDAVAFSPFDAIMRTPGDFSISPPAFQDVITPFGKNFELSDDWMISGSYISPVIHVTRSRKKPTTRLACSPPMSFMDRLQSHSSPAGVISPRHARTSTRSSSPLLSPCKLFPPSRPSVKKENDPHQQLRLQYHATNGSLFPTSPSVSRCLLSKSNDLSVRATEHRPTPRRPANTLPISPLTPLTPSPTKSIPPSAENKPRKRRLSMSESPTMRVKRMRYTSRRIDSLHDDASPAPILPRKKITPTPVFGMRTLPSAPFAVSPDFPLFYRRFPIPSYLRVGKFGLACHPCDAPIR